MLLRAVSEQHMEVVDVGKVATTKGLDGGASRLLKSSTQDGKQSLFKSVEKAVPALDGSLEVVPAAEPHLRTHLSRVVNKTARMSMEHPVMLPQWC